MSSASDNNEPPKGQKRGRGKRKRSQNSSPSMRRFALRYSSSSSSSCSTTPDSQAKLPGGARPTHHSLYGGALRRMQRCPAVPSKMPGKRYCLRKSQPTNLALTLAEALGHNKPSPGDEMPGPSQKLSPLKEEERPTKRRRGERPSKSSEQSESTIISEAVRPAKAPRKGFSCMRKMSEC